MDQDIASLLNDINAIYERKRNIEELIKLSNKFSECNKSNDSDNSYKFNCGNLTIAFFNKDIRDGAKDNTVFLDPAGSAFFGTYANAIWGGGGVSGVLYEYSKINGEKIKNYLSHEDFDRVQKRNGAVYHKYDNCGIIHVVSFDFRGGEYDDDTIEDELFKSYTQVYDEYNNKVKDAFDFRMVTLSGSIFSGKYQDKILNMTPRIIYDIFVRIDKPININLYELSSNSFDKLIDGFRHL